MPQLVDLAVFPVCSLLIFYVVRNSMPRYPITAATWEPEKGMGNLAVLIKRFNQDALDEGLDPNKNGVILLKEAAEGGWLEGITE